MGWRKEKTDEKDKHHHTFGEGLQQVGDFFDEDDDDDEVYEQTEEERQEAAEREIERMRMLLERTDTLSACGMQFSEELIAKLVIITLVLNVVAGAILLVTGMISWQRGAVVQNEYQPAADLFCYEHMHPQVREFENDVDCNASETFARGNIGKTQTVEEWKTYSIPDNTGMYWLSAVSGGLYVLLSICGLVAVLKRHSVLLLTYQAALTFAALGVMLLATMMCMVWSCMAHSNHKLLEEACLTYFRGPVKDPFEGFQFLRPKNEPVYGSMLLKVFSKTDTQKRVLAIVNWAVLDCPVPALLAANASGAAAAAAGADAVECGENAIRRNAGAPSALNCLCSLIGLGSVGAVTALRRVINLRIAKANAAERMRRIREEQEEEELLLADEASTRTGEGLVKVKSEKNPSESPEKGAEDSKGKPKANAAKKGAEDSVECKPPSSKLGMSRLLNFGSKARSKAEASTATSPEKKAGQATLGNLTFVGLEGVGGKVAEKVSDLKFLPPDEDLSDDEAAWDVAPPPDDAHSRLPPVYDDVPTAQPVLDSGPAVLGEHTPIGPTKTE